MEHIPQGRLFAYVLDNEDLSVDEHTHLTECAQCAAVLDEVKTLARDLAVARHSEPSTEARQTYYSVFEDNRRRQNPLAQAWDWINAHLVFDSRVQPLAAGTRSVLADSYRLLFEAAHGELELFVESDGLTRRVQGDLMLEDGSDASPVLVELLAAETASLLAETSPDPDGRFHFAAVPTGTYSMLLTGPGDALLEISELTIT